MQWLTDLLITIDEHNGAVTAFATVALAILTLTYVLLTRKMLKHMQKAHLPNLVAGFDFGESGIELLLRITNMGSMSAKGICIEVIKESITWTGKNDGLSQLAPVRHGISYLPPNQQMTFRVGFIDWNKTTEKSEIELTLNYKSPTDEKLHTKLYLDLDQFEGMLINKAPEAGIVRVLERIERQLKPSISPFRKPRCKYCKEEIKLKAKVCPHCQSHLNIRSKIQYLRKTN